MQEEILNHDIIASLGISDAAIEEVQCIIGRMPTVDEVSTLLAMWESNGKQQSFYGWLKGQHHTISKNEYLYSGDDETHKSIKEPKVKECLEIAKQLFHNEPNATQQEHSEANKFLETGNLIYMAGKVASDFLGSTYATTHLHLSSAPATFLSDDESISYTEMILNALLCNNIINSLRTIELGGLFGALLRCTPTATKTLGFDILTCREVRLDSFLFGETAGRYILSLKEESDDEFLQKMDDAGVDCCFLGRVTKGRIVVDGMDWGERTQF